MPDCESQATQPDRGVRAVQSPDAEPSGRVNGTEAEGPSLGLIKRRHLAHGLGLADLESAAERHNQRQSSSRYDLSQNDTLPGVPKPCK